MLDKIVKEEKGMMTVEAAVIIPAISFILVGIVFLFLFFLDMSAVKSEAMRVAGEAASSWKTDGSLVTGEYDEHALLTRNIYFLVTGSRKALTAEAEQRMTKRINERLLITRVDQSSVTINMQKVKAEAELHFRWPLRGVEKMMGQLLSFSCTTASPVDSWEEQLRLGASLR
ncbi:MAG TPA: hypothetical protein H9934_05655 [Candidatus Anaerobutyricum faecale]|uniref:hypothetical protein n=1 Tax=Eubacterium sp. An11 TaxID=1965542 RepID=UPI000B36EB91|nr:hypothetical protein [Eubacterium sp. An11]OUQ68593.1 hypothetical protein B5E53_06270 [Eubacterium sp. An11]HJC31597.1 hypothetical protein [Candidatus Anaerobutyricum faecale]